MHSCLWWRFLTSLSFIIFLNLVRLQLRTVVLMSSTRKQVMHQSEKSWCRSPENPSRKAFCVGPDPPHSLPLALSPRHFCQSSYQIARLEKDHSDPNPPTPHVLELGVSIRSLCCCRRNWDEVNTTQIPP